MLKRIKQAVGLLFFCCALYLSGIAACAQEMPQAGTEVGEELRIRTAEEFLTFADACRLDSYSQGLSVVLEGDIDLAGTGFAGIPIFCGTLEGGGHIVSGLSLDADGSVQGLFRYLTETAVVRNLTVQGRVTPQGSRAGAGGIAGENAGRIEGCSFSGYVSGGDAVGGIAGRNMLTGVVENCGADGRIAGKHTVGGIVGENAGVLRDCVNLAQINTNAQENTVKLSDITVDALIHSESANVATDVGGVAGISSGVIRGCENRGDVGYVHMGYNIGGIAGTQAGYIVDCRNQGSIRGRKEVGGIVGQMEPAIEIVYSADTLQILQGQVNTLSALTDRASANVQNSTDGINKELAALRDQVESVKGALKIITPGYPPDLSQMPNRDNYLAAVNQLNKGLGDMEEAVNRIFAATQSTAQTLSSDLRAVTDQVNVINRTLQHAPQNLGVSAGDISDRDTEGDIAGKVENCVNLGLVQADGNAGGIAGAVAPENDLDGEDDWEIKGEDSLNSDWNSRAVILRCENRAQVQAKWQNAGGIAGWQPMGLIRQCVNTGNVEAEGAENVGGIAGVSEGYLRDCSAKCELTGDVCVGGIAGSGRIVSDCRSMVLTRGGKEKKGAILGIRSGRDVQEETPVRGNVYLVVEEDIGGIDGVSYSGCAEPLPQESFLALEDLPASFQMVTLSFVYEDGTMEEIRVEPGGRLDTARIPELPPKEGYTAVWENLEDALSDRISFDTVLSAAYLPFVKVAQSEEVRGDGRPVMLLQGAFAYDFAFSLFPAEFELPEGSGETLVEAWHLEHADNMAPVTGRYLVPDGFEAKELKILLSNDGKEWKETAFEADGSYLVFPLLPGESGIAILKREDTVSGTMVIIVCAASTFLLVNGIVFCRKKRKKGKKES